MVLTKAHPNALHALDKTRNLNMYPFMIVACTSIPAKTNAISNPHNDTNRVEAIYRLLRNAPDLAMTKSPVYITNHV